MFGLLRAIKNRFQKRALKARYEEFYDFATIGSSFVIEGGSAIQNESGDKSKIVIGDKTRLVNAVLICKENARIEVGSYCVLQGGVNVCSLESVTIGDFVGIASGTTIADNNTHALGVENWIRHRIRAAPGGQGYPGLGNGWELSESSPVHIGDAVWIGSNCRINKGVSIGDGAIVAANSVVTKNVKAFTIVAGNPAKEVKVLTPPTRSIVEIAERLKEKLRP